MSSGGAGPRALILTGFMGTGKSAAGRLVAQRMGRPFVDLDAEIERAAGQTIAEISRSGGEARFREIEREAFLAALAVPDVVIATGGGTLLGADSRAAALGAGVVVCLRATPEAILSRVGDAAERPLLAGVADPLERIRALLAEREAVYALFPIQVDTTGKTPGEVAAEVIARWQATNPVP